jgi:hypothetical protein
MVSLLRLVLLCVVVKAIGTGRAYVVAALGTYMDSVAVTVQ